MRWKQLVMVALLSLCDSRAVMSQSSDTAVRMQVLATDDRRIEALRSGDAGPLREIYADDYTLITPAGVVRSKADQINELTSGRLRQKIDVVARTVRIYDDVAVIVSQEKSDILLDGRQVGGDMRLTRVYKKFGSEWRVIATHGSLLR